MTTIIRDVNGTRHPALDVIKSAIKEVKVIKPEHFELKRLGNNEHSPDGFGFPNKKIVLKGCLFAEWVMAVTFYLGVVDKEKDGGEIDVIEGTIENGRIVVTSHDFSRSHDSPKAFMSSIKYYSDKLKAIKLNPVVDSNFVFFESKISGASELRSKLIEALKVIAIQRS